MGEPETTAIEFRTVALGERDAAALVAAMRDEMASVYEGLEIDSAAMPKAGAAELGPPHGAFIVGYRDGQPSCGGVKRLDAEHCELKRMFVAPAARGQGVARRLLNALQDAARELGYLVARLDTGPRQPAARHLYESEGFVEIGNFNGNPVASYFAEKSLV